jgi:hypothetical protein
MEPQGRDGQDVQPAVKGRGGVTGVEEDADDAAIREAASQSGQGFPVFLERSGGGFDVDGDKATIVGFE